ncbi:MAG: HD domain-containing protein [Candidatus Saganbacteria bacterium]|nr:HD domain-containing protein [Candidatus Saganbacteria bacterium]
MAKPLLRVVTQPRRSHVDYFALWRDRQVRIRQFVTTKKPRRSPSTPTAARAVTHVAGVTPLFRPSFINPAPYTARLRRLKASLPNLSAAANELLDVAYKLAFTGHFGVFRDGVRAKLRREGVEKEPYIEHPVSVAEEARKCGMTDPEELAAILIHDVIEDVMLAGKRVTPEQLEKMLTPRVAFLANGVTEAGKEPDYTGPMPTHVAIILKLLEAGAEEIATLLIKLFDRNDNMNTLDCMKAKGGRTKNERQAEKAEETMKVYVPMADRFGIWYLKRSYEDISFKYLEPREYRRVQRRQAMVVRASKPRVEVICAAIRRELGVGVKVKLERRGIYELHQRIQLHDLNEVSPSDVWRINVIVSRGPQECATIQFRIHKLFRPIKGRQNDFINNPLTNFHRFLETWVDVEGFGELLIHIMTPTMYEDYQFGLIARRQRRGYDPREARNLLLGMLDDLRKEGLSSQQFFEVLADMPNPVQIITPKGDVKEFPPGSTGYDVAAMRSDVFRRAIGIKINDHERPLSVEVRNRDRVEVLLSPGREANLAKLEWLNHIHTLKGAQELRRALKAQALTDRAKVIEIGRQALDVASSRRFVPVRGLVNTTLFRRYLTSQGFLKALVARTAVLKIFAKRVGMEKLEEIFGRGYEANQVLCRALFRLLYNPTDRRGKIIFRPDFEAVLAKIEGDDEARAYFDSVRIGPGRRAQLLRLRQDCGPENESWKQIVHNAEAKTLVFAPNAEETIGGRVGRAAEDWNDGERAQMLALLRSSAQGVEELFFKIGTAGCRPEEVVLQLERMHKQAHRDNLTNPHMRMGPYYVSVITRDRVGLGGDLLKAFGEMGYNIKTFSVPREEGIIEVVIEVEDVMRGRGEPGMVGELQRLMIREIARRAGKSNDIGGRDICTPSERDVLDLLKRKAMGLEYAVAEREAREQATPGETSDEPAV